MARPTQTDALLLAQTVSYAALSITELFVIISLRTTQDNLGGDCILFADFNLTDKAVNLSVINESKTCDFIVYTSIIEECLVVLLCLYHMYMFHKSKRDTLVGEALIVKPALVFTFICGVFGFILAGTASAGFLYTAHWFPTFYLLSDPDVWKDRESSNNLTINTQITQVSLWICCCLWIVILAMTIVRYFHQKRLVTAKQHAAILLEHSRTNSDEILYETKRNYRS
ncbi:uncharacterized protein [Watersipora subatra]|uniref:uncharacterized protein n=1 Tax=Watersipora subatra TaxID=2589382 RepID=UPI00355BAADC